MSKKLLKAGTLVKILTKTVPGYENTIKFMPLKNQVRKIDKVRIEGGIKIYEIDGWYFMPNDVKEVGVTPINLNSQKGRILKLLKTKRWIKVQQLHEIAWRYGAHLCQLRKAGYVMTKRRQKDSRLEEWKLI